MLVVLLCFVLAWLYYQFGVYVNYLPIFFRVAFLALIRLGHSIHLVGCPFTIDFSGLILCRIGPDIWIKIRWHFKRYTTYQELTVWASRYLFISSTQLYRWCGDCAGNNIGNITSYKKYTPVSHEVLNTCTYLIQMGRFQEVQRRIHLCCVDHDSSRRI